MDEQVPFFAALFFTAVGLTALLTRVIAKLFLVRARLDTPAEQSMHSIPRPHSGGIGVMCVILGLLGVTAMEYFDLFFCIVLAGSGFLCLVSWFDDEHNLNPFLRLVMQASVIAIALIFAPSDWVVTTAYIPLWLDRLLTGFAWLWFVNLYNFMDGIDGMTGAQTCSLGIGGTIILMIAGVGIVDPLLISTGWVLAGCGIGFLIWNWHPARIFIGDTGAVPLGFLVGWFLLSMAAYDFFWAAVIISLYYCFDASYTVLMRMIRGQKVLARHQSYGFQQGVLNGYDHDQVVGIVIILNVFLFVCAMIVGFPRYDILTPIGVLVASLGTILILRHFHGKKDIDYILGHYRHAKNKNT